MPKRKLSAEEEEDRRQNRNKKRREAYAAKKRSLAYGNEAENPASKNKNKRRCEAHHMKKGQLSHEQKGENYSQEEDPTSLPLMVLSIEEERKRWKNEKRREARARTRQLRIPEKRATSIEEYSNPSSAQLDDHDKGKKQISRFNIFEIGQMKATPT